MVERVLLVASEALVTIMAFHLKVEVVLKFVTTVNGELYVMTIGVPLMLKLPATSWASQKQVRTISVTSDLCLYLFV